MSCNDVVSIKEGCESICILIVDTCSCILHRNYRLLLPPFKICNYKSFPPKRLFPTNLMIIDHVFTDEASRSIKADALYEEFHNFSLLKN